MRYTGIEPIKDVFTSPTVKGSNVVKIEERAKTTYGGKKGDFELLLCLMDDNEYHLRTLQYFKKHITCLHGERFKDKYEAKRRFFSYTQ